MTTCQLLRVITEYCRALVRRYAPSAGIDFLREGLHDSKLASLIASATVGNDPGEPLLVIFRPELKDISSISLQVSVIR